MTRSHTDRGSVLLLSLAVVTAMGLTTSVLLQASQAVLRRERSVWSSVVALSDVQSLAVATLERLEHHTTASCATVTSWTLPSLDNGSSLQVTCAAGPPQPWTVTMSASHGPRSVALVLRVAVDSGGRPQVQTRSVLTGPSPALTSAA